jgi:sulfur-carrier protein adenylyltransferase/sulfurtransferase
MKSYAELLAEARARIQEISVKDLVALRHTTGDVIVLDVREDKEYNLGTIPGAITIGRSNLEKNVEAQVPREKTVIVFCSSGNRSVFAAETLRSMGYEHVRSLKEGFSGWVAEGGEVE